MISVKPNLSGCDQLGPLKWIWALETALCKNQKFQIKKKNNNNSVFADELFTCHGAVLLCESFWFLQDCVDVSTTVFWLCLMVYNCGITSFDSVNVLYDILAALCYSQWHLFYHLVLDIFIVFYTRNVETLLLTRLKWRITWWNVELYHMFI